ncbi:PorT family protein [Microvirga sp. STR05]|uniref:PorT family protein n=1 Tax=Hymenobacter duratus TaxID=2771356 RepID=A0ABR8JBN0_9BACT|nr:porin family protein [Hymenobacter duratus]MBD2714126.1 PorT family protein [Hymenobacter duratus]MBR7949028.1 PorT family protein [Microvirga sp. STR05]
MHVFPRLLGGLLLLLAGSAHAQLGLRAGANTTTIATKTPQPSQQASADAKTGYQVGVFYEHRVNTRFSVVPELQFSRQHTQLRVRDYAIADGGYAADYRLSQSYVHLPVLLRARFGCFYAEAGPQGSLQVASREVGGEEIETIAGSFRRDFDRAATDSYSRLDVGVCAGLGVQLPSGFGIGVRASAGLLPLTPKEQRLQDFSIELRSQMVQASVSYQLRPRS